MYVEVLACPQCGAPLHNRDQRFCDFCGSEYVIRSLKSLDRFDRDGIDKYIQHFRQAIGQDRNDSANNLSLGLCYMNLGMFELAQQYLDKAIEHSPESGECYYYAALNIVRDRKPHLLNLQDVKKIEQHIRAAVQIDPDQGIYYAFWIILRQEYYERNGLRTPNPPMQELFEQLQINDFDDVEFAHLTHRLSLELTAAKRMLRR